MKYTVILNNNGDTSLHFFTWLSEAVEFATITGGVLKNEFNAM